MLPISSLSRFPQRSRCTIRSREEVPWQTTSRASKHPATRWGIRRTTSTVRMASRSWRPVAVPDGGTVPRLGWQAFLARLRAQESASAEKERCDIRACSHMGTPLIWTSCPNVELPPLLLVYVFLARTSVGGGTETPAPRSMSRCGWLGQDEDHLIERRR